ncbi:MAG: pyridoxal-phosphate dependent enzyme [Pseudomonadota bacterium]
MLDAQDDPVGIEDIRAAADRLDGVARTTPLLESPHLNRLAGRRVLVKAECLQLTGSFKFRGAWSALTALPEDVRARGVIGYSSGNHAQGVAHAAELMGIPAVIVMPADAPALKIANTRAHGAEVVLYDRQGGESREAAGEAIAAERGLTLVRPFDEPMVIAGQGTCGLEIAAQAAAAGVTEADCVICTGGGGLAAGIAIALEADAPGLRPRPAEPSGYDDWAKSLVSGGPQPCRPNERSICDAILTPAPGKITWPIFSRLSGPGIVITDDEAMHAMAAAFLRLKVVLEPGGAAALAAILSHGDEIEGDAVICTASGGNVDPAVFTQALERHAAKV